MPGRVNRIAPATEHEGMTSLATAPTPRARAVSRTSRTAAHLRATTGRDAARATLAVAAAGAGAIHLASSDAHLTDWAPLGYGFLLAAVAQVAWAVALVRRDSRPLLAAGAAATALVLGTWVLSRTTGLPVGPRAGVPEPVGAADLICAGLELPVLLGAALLAMRPRTGHRPLGRRARRTAGMVLVGVLATTGTALAQPPHQHDDPGTPALETGVDRNGDGVDDGLQAYFADLFRKAHEGHKGYEGLTG